jgi:hypothetical protein
VSALAGLRDGAQAARAGGSVLERLSGADAVEVDDVEHKPGEAADVGARPPPPPSGGDSRIVGGVVHAVLKEPVPAE